MEKHLFSFLAIFLFCVLTSASAQTTRYVKESSTGNGTSWASASGDLQDVINSSGAGDQIWVSKGTYYPIRKANDLNTVSINDRDNAFVLKANVKIYGGFTGVNDTDLTQRDSTGATNNTILSGDIGTIGDSTDNAYHVIISVGDVGTAELNGFSINGGNADANPFVSGQYITVFLEKIYKTAGGAMNISSSSPTLTNITITGSYADAGGGIYISSSSPTLTNVTISGNNATYGGGMLNSNSSPVITNVTITGNGNSGTGGGGMSNESNSSPVLTNVIISGNTGDYGGGISNYTSVPVITNVTISGNLAYRGAGIFNFQSSPVLTNVTISGNNASGSGGGIFNSTDTYPEIRNSIIYGNSDGIGKVAASVSFISYSLVQGLTPFAYNPKIIRNNIISGTVNPEFISMPSFETAPFTGGDYRLQAESPVIDRGSDAYFSVDSIPDLSAIATDLDGNPRKTGATDMGSYEYFSVLPVTIVSFKAQAKGNRAKLSWTTATEINNKEFVISRSADGRKFSEIGSLQGAGNTSTEMDYIYYDENPLNGNNFYKLEQVDFDGRKTVVGIRPVNFSSSNKIIIYPNPVISQLQIEFAAGVFQKMELTDVSGQVLTLIKIAKADTRQVLNLSNFPSGTYFIRFTGNGHVETRRVVKE